jgi:predicted acyl esterase
VDAKGTSWNICDGLLRLDATPPADADGWTGIEVPMSATAHHFAPGHCLRVQVSDGAPPLGPKHWHPRADRDGHQPHAGGY